MEKRIVSRCFAKTHKLTLRISGLETRDSGLGTLSINQNLSTVSLSFLMILFSSLEM